MFNWLSQEEIIQSFSGLVQIFYISYTNCLISTWSSKFIKCLNVTGILQNALHILIKYTQKSLFVLVINCTLLQLLILIAMTNTYNHVNILYWDAQYHLSTQSYHFDSMIVYIKGRNSSLIPD